MMRIKIKVILVYTFIREEITIGAATDSAVGMSDNRGSSHRHIRRNFPYHLYTGHIDICQCRTGRCIRTFINGHEISRFVVYFYPVYIFVITAIYLTHNIGINIEVHRNPFTGTVVCQPSRTIGNDHHYFHAAFLSPDCQF